MFVHTIRYLLGPPLPLPFSKLGSLGRRTSSLGYNRRFWLKTKKKQKDFIYAIMRATTDSFLRLTLALMIDWIARLHVSIWLFEGANGSKLWEFLSSSQRKLAYEQKSKHVPMPLVKSHFTLQAVFQTVLTAIYQHPWWSSFELTADTLISKWPSCRESLLHFQYSNFIYKFQNPLKTP